MPARTIPKPADAANDTPAAAVRRQPGRPKRVEGDPERQVREEILIAASRLFAENGFPGTSMRRIADELGMRGPSIYHYFRDKESILQEIARYTIETSLIYADSLTASADPASKQIHDMLVEHIQRLRASPYDLKALTGMRAEERANLGAWDAQVALWGQRLRSLIAKGIETGEFAPIDVEMAYLAIMGMVASVLRPVQLELHLPPRETGEFIADFALRSLKTAR